MNEFILWTVSFISLFLSFFWISVIYLKVPKEGKLSRIPKVTVVIPAYNEEKTIKETITSILNLDYPKDKLEVIVVNDGSTDNTEKIVKSIKKKNLILINQENKGKGSALNTGLKKATGELFGCLDADSFVNKDSLKKMVCLFENEKTGAVITAIKIREPKNIFEKIQHLEYIFAAFTRKLMSKIETLHTTPGVLSLYRTKILKKLGGFDENNLTEDLEIAMRLKYHSYNVVIASDAFTYTNAPRSFKTLWNQRVRWFRGFIYNTKKYKDMFLSKRYGMMGLFQVPLNVLTVTIILFMFFLISYEFLRRAYQFIIKAMIYKTDLIYSYELPTIKELVTSLDIKILFPISIAFLLGLYIYNKAHESAEEKWKFPTALLIYLTVYPILRSLHWITAVFKESINAKRKW